MKFSGFDEKDFDLFLIDGLEERMTALQQQLRPKFHQIGDDLSMDLSSLLGEEVFAHVAKHARRKTNPPNDSWVAFATNKRGYKMMPHFQITVWNTHLIIQWGLIYEAKSKHKFADNMISHLEEIRSNIPSDYHFFKDHMKPEGFRLADISDTDLISLAKRLRDNKNGELMVGKVFTKHQVLQMSPREFYQETINTWEHLTYLHRLALSD